MAIVKLMVEGGNMTPGPAVAQALGPMGVNLNQVISDVNKATSEFKGVNLPVHLTVNADTKEVSIKVLSPPTSELIKKELRIETASGNRLKQRVGNFAIEQVIAIAKSKHDSMLSNNFMSTLKSILGTCQALGVLVESKEIKEILEEINDGKYNEEIEAKKTDVDPDKRKELDNYFAGVATKQEAVKRAEDAEAAAAADKAATKATKGAKTAKK